jgi:3'(2'), 5'-bisphosphate nucleotidase
LQATPDWERFRREAADSARIADLAGRALLDLRAREPLGRELAGKGDRLANDLILDEIRKAYPDDAILSEEAADDRTRLMARRVWIVDPLDGSREFGEGRDDWAVHVALLCEDQLAAGAVALPALGVTRATNSDFGPPPAEPAPVRIVVSRSRPPAMADHVARRVGGEIVTLGSAGRKAMAVVLGEVEAYLHAGGQHEWDAAAPAVVAMAAGLHVSRIDGSPMRFNKPEPLLPDLLICRPHLAEPMLAAIREQLQG